MKANRIIGHHETIVFHLTIVTNTQKANIESCKKKKKLVLLIAKSEVCFVFSNQNPD